MNIPSNEVSEAVKQLHDTADEQRKELAEIDEKLTALIQFSRHKGKDFKHFLPLFIRYFKQKIKQADLMDRIQQIEDILRQQNSEAERRALTKYQGILANLAAEISDVEQNIGLDAERLLSLDLLMFERESVKNGIIKADTDAYILRIKDTYEEALSELNALCEQYEYDLFKLSAQNLVPNPTLVEQSIGLQTKLTALYTAIREIKAHRDNAIQVCLLESSETLLEQQRRGFELTGLADVQEMNEEEKEAIAKAANAAHLIFCRQQAIEYKALKKQIEEKNEAALKYQSLAHAEMNQDETTRKQNIERHFTDLTQKSHQAEVAQKFERQKKKQKHRIVDIPKLAANIPEPLKTVFENKITAYFDENPHLPWEVKQLFVEKLATCFEAMLTAEPSEAVDSESILEKQVEQLESLMAIFANTPTLDERLEKLIQAIIEQQTKAPLPDVSKNIRKKLKSERQDHKQSLTKAAKKLPPALQKPFIEQTATFLLTIDLLTQDQLKIFTDKLTDHLNAHSTVNANTDAQVLPEQGEPLLKTTFADILATLLPEKAEETKDPTADEKMPPLSEKELKAIEQLAEQDSEKVLALINEQLCQLIEAGLQECLFACLEQDSEKLVHKVDKAPFMQGLIDNFAAAREGKPTSEIAPEAEGLIKNMLSAVSDGWRNRCRVKLAKKAEEILLEFDDLSVLADRESGFIARAEIAEQLYQVFSEELQTHFNFTSKEGVSLKTIIPQLAETFEEGLDLILPSAITDAWYVDTSKTSGTKKQLKKQLKKQKEEALEILQKNHLGPLAARKKLVQYRTHIDEESLYKAQRILNANRQEKSALGMPMLNFSGNEKQKHRSQPVVFAKQTRLSSKLSSIPEE